jgi:hypothetical protein
MAAMTPPAGSPSPVRQFGRTWPEVVEEFDAALVDHSATLSGQLVGPRSRERGPHVGDCGGGSAPEEPYELVVNGGF